MPCEPGDQALSTVPHPGGGPAAVLWDYDGTLIDTEPVWIEAEIEIMATHGLVWTVEDGMRLCGAAWDYSTREMLAAARRQGGQLPMGDVELYREMYTRVATRIAGRDLPWLPGVRELVDEMVARRLPMAVVSASPPEVLDAGLGRMPTGAFPVAVGGQDVSRGKPDPEGYLLAAQRLSVDIRHCLVVEDSVPGTLAGQAAGAVVISLGPPEPELNLPGIRRIQSLSGFTMEDVAMVWQELRESDD